MTSAARFDLAALLATAQVDTDGRGRVTLHFAYPSSPDGQLAVRHVHRPVLLHTRTGWVLRGRDGAREGQVRTFRVERITGRDTTLPPRRQHTAGGHAEGGDHERGRRPPPPRDRSTDMTDTDIIYRCPECGTQDTFPPGLPGGPALCPHPSSRYTVRPATPGVTLTFGGTLTPPPRRREQEQAS